MIELIKARLLHDVSETYNAFEERVGRDVESLEKELQRNKGLQEVTREALKDESEVIFVEVRILLIWYLS